MNKVVIDLSNSCLRCLLQLTNAGIEFQTSGPQTRQHSKLCQSRVKKRMMGSGGFSLRPGPLGRLAYPLKIAAYPERK